MTKRANPPHGYIVRMGEKHWRCGFEEPLYASRKTREEATSLCEEYLINLFLSNKNAVSIHLEEGILYSSDEVQKILARLNLSMERRLDATDYDSAQQGECDSEPKKELDNFEFYNPPVLGFNVTKQGEGWLARVENDLTSAWSSERSKAVDHCTGNLEMLIENNAELAAAVMQLR